MKTKTTTEQKKLRYLAIQYLFLKGTIKRMKDIEKLDPTMIAKDLTMNHSRYITKLYEPELFTIQQIKKLAALFELKPQILIDIILKESDSQNRLKKRKYS